MRHTPFDIFLVPERRSGNRRRVLTVPVSAALHALALAALLVAGTLAGSDLPPVSAGGRLTPPDPVVVQPPRPTPPPGPPTRGPQGPTRRGGGPQGPAVVVPTDIPSTLPVDPGGDVLDEPGLPPCLTGCGGGGREDGEPTAYAAPAPETKAPVRLPPDVRRPRKLRDVPPVYPPLAISIRLQGEVELDCVIDTTGRVQEVRPLSGHELLVPAAVEAVRQWVYTPTLLDGVPVPVILNVKVRFGLR